MPKYKTGKVKNGKVQYRVFVSVTNAKGETRQKTKCVYGLSEANEVEKQLEAEIRTIGTPSRMTVRELYDRYIESKKHDVRASSLKKTKSILSNHVLNTDIADKRLNKLTVEDCQTWKDAIGKKDIMISTKNNAYRELNTLLNFAVRMEYISRNPLKKVKRFKDTNFTAQEKIRYYTSEQFGKYIKAAENNRRDLTDYGCCIFFYIAFYTGMRKGEIHALKWSDISGGVIHITRSINQKVKDKNGNFMETAPKTKESIRNIRIPEPLMKLLEDHKQFLKDNIGYKDDYRVCLGYKPISDTTLENHNKLYAKLAGLPHRTIHEFRHSHATLLCNNNINIMEVSRRLGHKDVNQTWNTYAHLYPAAEEMAIGILNAALKIA